MAEPLLPEYPVYIPSKGRGNRSRAITAGVLMRDEVPFHVVVEPQEADEYAALVGEERVLVLPFSNLGLGSIPARNWIKDHATVAGAVRHWQLDDNMRQFRRQFRGQRIPCRAGIALRMCEEFTDRFTNVAISGLNYEMFGVNANKPFVANCHVYSATLVLNSIPHRWRGRYNEDADICLQVLADGWCTILINTFLADKIPTMVVKGGNTDELYAGDGRLRMARSLERVWPYVVEVGRRFERPQHVVRDSWRKFDTPLQLRPDLDLAALPAVDEHGIELRQIKETRSAPLLRRLNLEERPPGAPPTPTPQEETG